jgi:hypothetical protein
MPIKDQELWNRLWVYRFPDAGPIGAMRRSVRTDISRQHEVEQCLTDYRRFVYLLASGNKGLSPPPAIATIWFGHAKDRRTDYGRFEREVVGCQLPELPTSRFNPNAPDYLLSKEVYRQEFDVDPNPKIWPEKRMYIRARVYHFAAVLTLALAFYFAPFDIKAVTLSGALMILCMVATPILWLTGTAALPWNIGWPPRDDHRFADDQVLDLAEDDDPGHEKA